MDNSIQSTINALQVLEEDYNLLSDDLLLYIEDYHLSKFKKINDNHSFEFYLNISGCDDSYTIQYKDIILFLDELKTAELIKKAKNKSKTTNDEEGYLYCLTSQRCLVRIELHLNNESNNEILEYIWEKEDKFQSGLFEIQYHEKGIIYTCKLIKNFSIFGVLAAKKRMYDSYNNPFSADEFFIEVEFNQYDKNDTKNEKLAKIKEIYKAYIFDLSTQLDLDFIESPKFWDWNNEFSLQNTEPKKNFEQQAISTILSGKISSKGMSDILDLYYQAINTIFYDKTSAILKFTKIIEYISKTVAHKNHYQDIKNQLDSMDNSSQINFIKELDKIYSEYAKKTDKERIRETILECCDFNKLDAVISREIKNKIHWNRRNINELEKLKGLGSCIADTRNSIAHAKANYKLKGNEIPIVLHEQFTKCLKICVEQCIKWYANIPENERIYTEEK